MKRKIVIMVLCALTVFTVGAWAQGGASGATLQASKTLQICDNGDGTWQYFGEVSVWNTGTADANGLNITDCLQDKLNSSPKQPANVACLSNIQGSVTTIPGLTQEVDAIRFPYSFVGAYSTPIDPSLYTIRNSAQLNITNHSGGQVTGPNPKDTWTGGTPPSCGAGLPNCGCTYTQGYWDNKPGVVWPAGGPQRDQLFFNSGITYQAIMDAPDGGNAYIKLAHQYIAAVLNVNNQACEPSTVLNYINLSTGFFTGFATGSSYCAPNVCGLQVTWAGILADYNQGTGSFVSNPGHCQ